MPDKMRISTVNESSVHGLVIQRLKPAEEVDREVAIKSNILKNLGKMTLPQLEELHDIQKTLLDEELTE